MAKIVIAGGTGSMIPNVDYYVVIADRMTDVAREIIDVLAATKKHKILILSRKVCAYPNGARITADEVSRASHQIAKREVMSRMLSQIIRLWRNYQPSSSVTMSYSRLSRRFLISQRLY
jgi:hypothetical protein